MSGTFKLSLDLISNKNPGFFLSANFHLFMLEKHQTPKNPPKCVKHCVTRIMTNEENAAGINTFITALDFRKPLGEVRYQR